MTPDGIRWDLLRTEYVTGVASYETLAHRYNLDPSNVKRHGSAEGWAHDREVHRRHLAALAQQQQATQVVDRITALQGQTAMLLEDVLAKAHRSLALVACETPREFERLVQAASLLAKLLAPAIAQAQAGLGTDRVVPQGPAPVPETPISTEEAIKQVEGSLERLRAMAKRPMYHHQLPDNDAVPAFLRPRTQAPTEQRLPSDRIRR